MTKDQSKRPAEPAAASLAADHFALPSACQQIHQVKNLGTIKFEKREMKKNYNSFWFFWRKSGWIWTSIGLPGTQPDPPTRE